MIVSLDCCCSVQHPPNPDHTAAADVGAYTYGVMHAMKPQRMRITHELVSAYDMLPKMHVLVRLSISSTSGT